MDIKLVNDSNLKGFDIYKMSEENTNKKKEIQEQVKVTKEFDKKDLDKMVNELNKHLKKEGTHAKYDVHEKFGDIMIKIINDKTREVVMEFPPEKVLDMLAKLCETAGIVFSKKA